MRLFQPTTSIVPGPNIVTSVPLFGEERPRPSPTFHVSALAPVREKPWVPEHAWDFPPRTVKQSNMKYVMDLARQVLRTGKPYLWVNLVIATQTSDRDVKISFRTPNFMFTSLEISFFMKVLASELRDQLTWLNSSGCQLHHVKDYSIGI